MRAGSPVPLIEIASSPLRSRSQRRKPGRIRRPALRCATSGPKLWEGEAAAIEVAACKPVKKGRTGSRPPPAKSDSSLALSFESTDGRYGLATWIIHRKYDEPIPGPPGAVGALVGFPATSCKVESLRTQRGQMKKPPPA